MPRQCFEPAIEFGRRVRALREKQGRSQEALALDLELDRSYVGSIERGERNLSLNNICRIAEALSVDPSGLVKGLRPSEKLSTH